MEGKEEDNKATNDDLDDAKQNKREKRRRKQ